MDSIVSLGHRSNIETQQPTPQQQTKYYIIIILILLFCSFINCDSNIKRVASNYRCVKYKHFL